MSSHRPNVLLIVSDQQARRAQSATGNRWVRTPHLDALSASGIRFDKAYCTAPVCGPARSSLHTGRMPHDTGVIFNNIQERPDTSNVRHIFHEAGYDTAWAGHRYLPSPPPGDDSGDSTENRSENVLPPDFKSGLGVVVDEQIAVAAADYLRRDHERPFFLAVGLVNPHDICHWVMGAAESTAHDGELPPLPDNFAGGDPDPDFVMRCRRREHYGQENTYTIDWDERQWRIYLREYYRLTERVDAAAGQVLQTLRDEGLERDTIVLYTSDHGEGMAAHRWVVKLSLYEDPVSIPLTLSWPGVIEAGRVDTEHLVSGVDVLPTLCDYAEAPIPAAVSGHSLRDVIENPGASGREYVVSQLHPDTEDPDLAARMVRTSSHKYIAFSEGSPRELLFDMENDPGETRNMAGHPSWAEQLARHRRLLAEWIAETDDRFAPP